MNRAALAAAGAALATLACATKSPPPPTEDLVAAAAHAIRDGRFELAGQQLAQVRRRDPLHVDAARWSSVLAETLWDDERAVLEQTSAIRNARRAGVPDDEERALRGRLGDLLFQAGRWGDASAPLQDGTVGPAAQQRAAFAAVSRALPFVRKQSGPLATEQRLAAGELPEFVCGAAGRQCAFALDTGTSMTTLSRTFADELGVHHRAGAGTALDGLGRELAVEVGILDQFALGDVALGAIPVLVVDDVAMQLRDFHGGPERVPRGMVGLDVLAAFRITMDPERGTISLELPRGLDADDSLQCARVEGRCLVPIVVDGVRLWFVLDTGASHSSLTTLGIDALPNGRARAVTTYRPVRTVGGATVAVREIADLELRVSGVQFLGVTLPVVLRGQSGLLPVHGVLGMDLLSRCRITLDRGRVRMKGRE